MAPSPPTLTTWSVHFHKPPGPFTSHTTPDFWPVHLPQVRNFILELSMDQNVEQSLATRACENCGTETYEANLSCHNCKHKWEPCAVSGYPVQAHEKVVSKTNGFDVVAIRDHWNQWVTTFHSCPVTGGPAAPMY